MTTLTVPAQPRVRRHPALLTSEEFLDWLQPGIHADLIGGFIHMNAHGLEPRPTPVSTFALLASFGSRSPCG